MVQNKVVTKRSILDDCVTNRLTGFAFPSQFESTVCSNSGLRFIFHSGHREIFITNRRGLFFTYKPCANKREFIDVVYNIFNGLEEGFNFDEYR